MEESIGLKRVNSKYFAVSKIYTDKVGRMYKVEKKQGFSAFTGDNPRAKARGLSPRTAGQIMV